MRKYLPLLLLVSSPAFAIFSGGFGPGGGWIETTLGGGSHRGGMTCPSYFDLMNEKRKQDAAYNPEVAAKEDAAYKHEKSAKTIAERTSSVRKEIRELKRASEPELSSPTEKYHHTSTEKLVKDFCVDRCIDLKAIPDISEGELPYHFQSPEGDFRQEIVGVYKNLYKIEPKFKKQQNARAFGLAAAEEADKAFAIGQDEDANFFKEVAKEFLDVAVGIDPVTGFARNTYELFTGRNFINGAKLSDLERSLAFVGIVSLGGSNTVVKTGKGLLRIASKATTHLLPDLRKVRGLITDGRKIVASAVKIERFHPLNHGPLHLLKEGAGTVADTFRSSTYMEIVTKEPTKLYRVYGGEAGPLGRYWSRVKPTGPFQAVLDSALDPTWRNSAKHWIEVTVPSGTKLYEGVVSDVFLKLKGSDIAVGKLLGGGSQVYMTEKVLESWNIVKGAF